MSTKNKAARGKFYDATTKKKCDHKVCVQVPPAKPDCLECGRADPEIWRCVACGAVVP